MNPQPKKQRVVLWWVSGIAALMAVALCGTLAWKHTMLGLRVAFASDQFAVFEEMRVRALRSVPAEAVADLRYVVDYYPSGTKQDKGSRLDRMVEQARDLTIREIICDLRSKTGEDLGEKPEKWIRKFSKSSDPLDPPSR